jgi:hypothetical protein
MSSNSKDKKPTKQGADADDFESVAKRLECEDDKVAFERKLGKLAKAKPSNKRNG